VGRRIIHIMAEGNKILFDDGAGDVFPGRETRLEKESELGLLGNPAIYRLGVVVVQGI
jgi:hypothetical protein